MPSLILGMNETLSVGLGGQNPPPLALPPFCAGGSWKAPGAAVAVRLDHSRECQGPVVLEGSTLSPGGYLPPRGVQCCGESPPRGVRRCGASRPNTTSHDQAAKAQSCGRERKQERDDRNTSPVCGDASDATTVPRQEVPRRCQGGAWAVPGRCQGCAKAVPIYGVCVAGVANVKPKKAFTHTRLRLFWFGDRRAAT